MITPGVAFKNWALIRTSSRILFLARVTAAFRTLIQDSFSSGLTARKTRFGTCNTQNTGSHVGF